MAKRKKKKKPVYYAPKKPEKKIVMYQDIKLEYTGGRRNQCRSYRCRNQIIWIPESLLDGHKLKKGACIDDILAKANIIPKDCRAAYNAPKAQVKVNPKPKTRHHQLNSPSVSDTTKDNIVLPKNPNEYVYIPAKKTYSIIMKVSFLRRVGFLK